MTDRLQPTAAPSIRAVHPVSTLVEQYGKMEARIELTASYSNPYDYDAIHIRAVFTAPNDHSFQVDGFFMQEFEFAPLETGAIIPLNDGVFKIRFSPTLPGTWRYTVHCTTPGGTTIFPEQSFQCTSNTVDNQGFIRSNNGNYLQFDNGEPFLPIGINLAWSLGNPYQDYKNWLNQLSDNGGNFFRIWHAHWGLGIEWQLNNNGFSGLRYYNQRNSFYLDWLLEYCATKNIYLMLCLQHHGQVSTKVNSNWADNPYNYKNGGPCNNTAAFFDNTIAKNHVKNRLRYIIARWGHARHILAWELFNEVNWTDQFVENQTTIADWHAEMAAFLKQIDPYQHLVTTSYAGEQYDAAVWQNVNIDFTQTHTYKNASNLERLIADRTQLYLAQYNKPTLTGEFGLGNTSTQLAALDPDGIHIHNALWASLFSGGLGTAMSWWWDHYIAPQDLFYHFKPLAQVITNIHFKNNHFTPHAAKIFTKPENEVNVYTITSNKRDKIAAWILNVRYNHDFINKNGLPAPVHDAVLLIENVKNGFYLVKWLDCQNAEAVHSEQVEVNNHELKLFIPVFLWDITFIAEPIIELL